jgi:hypothetical protein
VIYRLIRAPVCPPLRLRSHPDGYLAAHLDAAWYGSSVGGQAPGQVILITSPALRTEITSVVHARNAGEASWLSPHRSPRASWSLDPNA